MPQLPFSMCVGIAETTTNSISLSRIVAPRSMTVIGVVDVSAIETAQDTIAAAKGT